MRRRLLVLTSCTSKKLYDHADALTIADFRDAGRRARREAALTRYSAPAGRFYTGEHHRLTMGGVEQIRATYGSDAVDVKIISAGYGLLDENRLLVPYNATFRDMRRPEARAWARALGIPREVRKCLADRPLAIVLLGEDYLDSIEPPLPANSGQRIVFFAKPSLHAGLVAPGVTVVAAGQTEATRYESGNIALKGKMFASFAAALVSDPRLWVRVQEDDSGEVIRTALALGVRRS